MWIYEQSSGRLYRDDDPETFYVGYAGRDAGKNNPDMQHVPNVGPIPCGFYAIGKPEDRPQSIGMYALPLTPFPENDMHGRSDFFMHGDSRAKPGHASHGCPIQSKPARMAVYLSDDHLLKVIRGA